MTAVRLSKATRAEIHARFETIARAQAAAGSSKRHTWKAETDVWARRIAIASVNGSWLNPQHVAAYRISQRLDHIQLMQLLAAYACWAAA